jgi:hypothetical protein
MWVGLGGERLRKDAERAGCEDSAFCLVPWEGAGPRGAMTRVSSKRSCGEIPYAIASESFTHMCAHSHTNQLLLKLKRVCQKLMYVYFQSNSLTTQTSSPPQVCFYSSFSSSIVHLSLSWGSLSQSLHTRLFTKALLNPKGQTINPPGMIFSLENLTIIKFA